MGFLDSVGRSGGVGQLGQGFLSGAIQAGQFMQQAETNDMQKQLLDMKMKEQERLTRPMLLSELVGKGTEKGKPNTMKIFADAAKIAGGKKIMLPDGKEDYTITQADLPNIQKFMETQKDLHPQVMWAQYQDNIQAMPELQKQLEKAKTPVEQMQITEQIEKMKIENAGILKEFGKTDNLQLKEIVDPTDPTKGKFVPEGEAVGKQGFHPPKPDSKAFEEEQVFIPLLAENKLKFPDKSDAELRLMTYKQIKEEVAGSQRSAAPSTQVLGPSTDENGQIIPGSYDAYDPVNRKTFRVGTGGKGFVGAKGMRPLPSEAASTLASIDTTIEDVDKVREAWKEGLTGPFQGNVNKALASIKDHPAFETLRRRSARLITVAYALSGKQISEREMKILEKSILPQVTQPDKNFLVALDELDDWLSRNQRNKRKEYRHSGYVVPDEEKAPASDEKKRLKYNPTTGQLE